MTPARFVIVNTTDAPTRKHVAEWVDGVGYCYMSRVLLPYLKKFDGMNPTRPTPMERFGFNVWVGQHEAEFIQDNVSTATYEDGKPRVWQDSEHTQFTLPLVGKVRKPRNP